MKKRESARCVLALSLALVASPLLAQTAAPSAEDGRWRFTLTPYLWASSQEGEASFKGIPAQPVEMSFGDIWDKLDFASQLAFEAHKGRWGFATDVVYMNLGAKIPRRVLDVPEPSVDLRQFVAEGVVLYRVYRGSRREGLQSYVDVLGGARYNDVSAGIQAELIPDTERSFGWLDGVAGARFQAALSPKVAVGGRADVAGFGSDFTWQARADVLVQLSRHWALGGGYRYLDTDYDEGTGKDRKLWSMVNKGPYLGVQIGW